MNLRRRLPKADSMRTLVVAAGGFSVGGLLMAGGLTFHSAHLLTDRINLQGQDAGGAMTQDQPTEPEPTGQAALAAAAPAVAPKTVVTSSSTRSSSTSRTARSKVTTAARPTHRTVYRQVAPVAPRRHNVAPPVVTSSGS
jgi:hypothetical protein